ncbi:glycine zipper 2TM domain-containing protein [Azoarcus sp. DN11]|uniref:glycine zipper 2TM domain-containing protein n=1 Tax=Azoarcus sp. DN11 TaxID=356837 RepID=UPI000EB02806|nr:glycine zipper 2TM domain-containing protein [Azoarcus sp. DN11]AYH41963.1 hypothetical protein CDA09_00950 [Azoarcus sp. DN11]
MDKSMMLGIGLGALGVTAGGAVATYNLVDHGPKYAEVVAVQPLKEAVKTPREVCKDVVVNHRAPVKDQHQIAGTVVGALAGGLLGNQIGAGSGKKVATLAGAAAGGYAGKKVQENMQANDTYSTTETRCKTVTDTSERVIGYDVKYRLGEQLGHVRMDHEPGERIPVKDGRLVLTGARSADAGSGS